MFTVFMTQLLHVFVQQLGQHWFDPCLHTFFSVFVVFYYNCPDVSCSSSLFCWICTVVLNTTIVSLSSKILLFLEVNWSLHWCGLYQNCLPLIRNYPLFGSQLKIVGFYIRIVSLCSEITLFSEVSWRLLDFI